MTAELKKALSGKLGGRALFGPAMPPRTTWGVGGPAFALCRVFSAEEAAFVVRQARMAGVDWMPLGRGSNLLVSDEGYQGVMLRLSGPLARVQPGGPGLLAGGGAGLASAVRLAASLGLSGLEWAAGIPATIGGAVKTNAGAHGWDMSGVAKSLTLLTPQGEVVTLPGPKVPAAYRRRELPRSSLVLSAALALEGDDPAKVSSRTRDYLQKRKAAQPFNARTGGSVFKNPPGDYAGRLIEQAGCKGMKRGGAVVSMVHANFIENTGSARAEDIRWLMEEIRRRVGESFGVELEPEVELVGHG